MNSELFRKIEILLERLDDLACIGNQKRKHRLSKIIDIENNLGLQAFVEEKSQENVTMMTPVVKPKPISEEDLLNSLPPQYRNIESIDKILGVIANVSSSDFLKNDCELTCSEDDEPENEPDLVNKFFNRSKASIVRSLMRKELILRKKLQAYQNLSGFMSGISNVSKKKNSISGEKLEVPINKCFFEDTPEHAIKLSQKASKRRHTEFNKFNSVLFSKFIDIRDDMPSEEDRDI